MQLYLVVHDETMLVVVTMLLGFSTVATQTPAATYGVNASASHTLLRRELLADYDAMVPPPGVGLRAINASAGQWSATGVEVTIEIRIMKVLAVIVADGSMRLKVWFRQRWKDGRLSWDPAQHGGLEYANFATDTWGERQEIWSPDVQLWNSMTAMESTLDQTMATVMSDGVVTVSRPGTLELMCRFSGLVAFPFDNLQCSFEVGGWTYSDFHQKIELEKTTDGEGFSIDALGGTSMGQEKTRGSSYQEYSVQNVTSKLITYSYRDASEPFTVALYTITLERMARRGFYGLYYIFPSIFLTFLSFTVFWAETASADALGFGISVLVVVMLLNIVLIGMVPVCGEMLWLDLFSIINVIFCCISLLHSALVIALESYQGDHLLPVWLLVGFSRASKALLPPRIHANLNVDEVLPPEDTVGGIRSLASSATIQESTAGILFRQTALASVSPPSPSPSSLPPAPDKSLTDAEAHHLVFFERMFLELDEDSSGYLSNEDVDGVLSFVALHLEPNTRRTLLESADLKKDGRLNRLEFCVLCRRALWNVPLQQLQLAVQNFKDIRSYRRRRNNKYWNTVAELVEVQARDLIPGSYTIILMLLFYMDFEDDYGVDSAHFSPKMKAGLGTLTMRSGWPIIFAPIAVVMVLLVLRLISKSLSARTVTKQKAKEDTAVRTILKRTRSQESTRWLTAKTQTRGSESGAPPIKITSVSIEPTHGDSAESRA